MSIQNDLKTRLDAANTVEDATKCGNHILIDTGLGATEKPTSWLGKVVFWITNLFSSKDYTKTEVATQVNEYFHIQLNTQLTSPQCEKYKAFLTALGGRITGNPFSGVLKQLDLKIRDITNEKLRVITALGVTRSDQLWEAAGWHAVGYPPSYPSLYTQAIEAHDFRDSAVTDETRTTRYTNANEHLTLAINDRLASLKREYGERAFKAASDKASNLEEFLGWLRRFQADPRRLPDIRTFVDTGKTPEVETGVVDEQVKVLPHPRVRVQ